MMEPSPFRSTWCWPCVVYVFVLCVVVCDHLVYNVHIILGRVDKIKWRADMLEWRHNGTLLARCRQRHPMSPTFADNVACRRQSWCPCSVSSWCEVASSFQLNCAKGQTSRKTDEPNFEMVNFGPKVPKVRHVRIEWQIVYHRWDEIVDTAITLISYYVYYVLEVVGSSSPQHLHLPTPPGPNFSKLVLHSSLCTICYTLIIHIHLLCRLVVIIPLILRILKAIGIVMIEFLAPLAKHPLLPLFCCWRNVICNTQPTLVLRLAAYSIPIPPTTTSIIVCCCHRRCSWISCNSSSLIPYLLHSGSQSLILF